MPKNDVLEPYRKAIAEAEGKGLAPIGWMIGGKKMDEVRPHLLDDISPAEHLPDHLRFAFPRKKQTLLGLSVETIFSDGAALQCLIFVGE